MNFFTLVGISTAVTNFLMTFIVLYSGRRKINIIWAFFCFSVGILGFCLTAVSLSQTPEEALKWWRLSYLGVTNLPVLILHTTFLMLQMDSIRIKKILVVSYGITILFHILNFQGLLIQKVTYLYNQIFFDTPASQAFVAFFLFFNIIFSVIFFLIFKSYKTSSEEQRKQLKYFAYGIGVGVIGGGALFLPVFGVKMFPYSALLTGIYPVIIGYSILRHHLFDAKYAVLQITRFLTILIFIGVLSLFLVYLSIEYLHYIPSFHPIEFSIWIAVFLFGVTLFRSKDLRSIFLIGSLKDLDREIEEFIGKKGVYQNSHTLLQDLESMFWGSMKIKKVQILHETTLKYPRCLKYFKKYSGPITLSELEHENIEGESPELVAEVSQIGEVIFPIEIVDKEGFIFLVLGPKESDDNISDEEIRIISRIIPKVTLALQVIDYHHTLQNEVRIQTKAIASKNQELETAYKKLEEIDQNKDNFLAIASHELRTPMTIIKGYADLFLQNALGPLSSDARSYIQKIFDSSESLIHLVNNILDISKIEAGRFEIVKSDISLQVLLQKCIDNFQNICSEKKITLSLAYNSTIQNINTDEGKVLLLCTNLLSNAYKFSTVGGKIELKTFDEAGYVHIMVTDTGMGIDKQQLSHVFEKFNQADNSSNYTKKSIHGTGLGLYLCKQIVELLGGSIRVQSEKGVGSSFTFTLPISSYDVSKQ